MPGLAMSRSIGDSQVHGVGVSPDPQINEMDIADRILRIKGKDDTFNKNSAMLILGTDGIFDVVSNDETAAALFPASVDLKQQQQMQMQEEKYSAGLDLDSSLQSSIHSDKSGGGKVLAAGVSEAADRLIEATHTKWLSQVGLADDMSIIIATIACSIIPR